MVNPAKNYQRGVAFEYKVMKYLKERDWLCVRSAGSHGPVDIVAIKDEITWLIQCKIRYGMLPDHNIRELMHWAPADSTIKPIYGFGVSKGMSKKGRPKNDLVLMNLHTRVDVLTGEKLWQGSK